MGRKRYSKEPHITLTAWIPKHQLKALRSLSRIEKRSSSEIVRRFIEDGLNAVITASANGKAKDLKYVYAEHVPINDLEATCSEEEQHELQDVVFPEVCTPADFQYLDRFLMPSPEVLATRPLPEDTPQNGRPVPQNGYSTTHRELPELTPFERSLTAK